MTVPDCSLVEGTRDHSTKVDGMFYSGHPSVCRRIIMCSCCILECGICQVVIFCKQFYLLTIIIEWDNMFSHNHAPASKAESLRSVNDIYIKVRRERT